MTSDVKTNVRDNTKPETAMMGRLTSLEMISTNPAAVMPSTVADVSSMLKAITQPKRKN